MPLPPEASRMFEVQKGMLWILTGLVVGFVVVAMASVGTPL